MAKQDTHGTQMEIPSPHTPGTQRTPMEIPRPQILESLGTPASGTEFVQVSGEFAPMSKPPWLEEILKQKSSLGEGGSKS